MILNVNQTSRVTIIIHAPNKILESHQNHHSCQFLYPQNPPFLPFQGSMPSWRSRRSAERQKPPAWRKPLPMPSWVGRGGLLETSHESLGQQQEPCCFTPGEKNTSRFFMFFCIFTGSNLGKKQEGVDDPEPSMVRIRCRKDWCCMLQFHRTRYCRTARQNQLKWLGQFPLTPLNRFLPQRLWKFAVPLW